MRVNVLITLYDAKLLIRSLASVDAIIQVWTVFWTEGKFPVSKGPDRSKWSLIKSRFLP